MFRVYDNVLKKWVNENIYMHTNGDLYVLNNSKNIFSKDKLKLLEDDGRYICHRGIGLQDNNGIEVFEGDYIRAVVGKIDEYDENSEDKIEIGIVAYAHELSAYIILCKDSDIFYTLGSDVTEFIKVIGNVFDGYDGEECDGKQSLQEA